MYTDLYCDRCGAAAKQRFLLSNDQDLVFCGHHSNEYSLVLIEAGAAHDIGFVLEHSPELQEA